MGSTGFVWSCPGSRADCCNKKKLIVICDMVTVICYLTAAAMYGSQWKTAAILQTQTIVTAWKSVTAAGALGTVLYLILIKTDQKTYPLLYPRKGSKTR